MVWRLPSTLEPATTEVGPASCHVSEKAETKAHFSFRADKDGEACSSWFRISSNIAEVHEKGEKIRRGDWEFWLEAKMPAHSGGGSEKGMGVAGEGALSGGD